MEGNNGGMKDRRMKFLPSNEGVALFLVWDENSRGWRLMEAQINLGRRCFNAL